MYNLKKIVALELSDVLRFRVPIAVTQSDQMSVGMRGCEPLPNQRSLPQPPCWGTGLPSSIPGAFFSSRPNDTRAISTGGKILQVPYLGNRTVS